jgi:hypothetical protein
VPRSLLLLFGPRAPREELRAHPARYLSPSALLVLAALCLLLATRLPVWSIVLHAPQYPKGLTVTAYIDRLTGDVEEVNRLNHYIGMRPLEDAAKVERQMGVYALIGLALLCASATLVHTKWAAALAAPALGFPVVFMADLHYWLADSGKHLDPHAPLSHAIKPFVPPVLGTGKIGQFHTVALVEEGYLLALLASALIVVGLYLHRRAYKPLLEQAMAAPEVSRAAP